MDFTSEQVQEHINGLQASVAVIEKLMADNIKTQEKKDTMDRNVRHLEIMMAYDHIKNAGVSLDPYAAAVQSGKAWMNS